MAFEASKRAAALRAVELVQDGMRVGLGTGSTSEEMVRALAEKGLHLEVVPTSARILELARGLGLSVVESYPDFGPLDIALDGADEVAPDWGLIKGGGAALLREKLVARAARRFVVMVDESKWVPQLGTTRGVPVEVVPFGWDCTRRAMEELPGLNVARLRFSNHQVVLTDHGNYVFDCEFQGDARRLHEHLKAIAGVVETGFFFDMAHVIVTGSENGDSELRESSP